MKLMQSGIQNNKRIQKWDSIYKEQNKRWNGLPSKLAETTLKFIYHNEEIDGIVDVGGGYGRDSIYFLNYEYKVTNIESSETALTLFKNDYPKEFSEENISLFKGDALELTSFDSVRDGKNLIFCNYFLHLLSIEELNSFLQIFVLNFKSKTQISFNLISKKDFRYNGNQIEEVEQDIHWSFWNKDDILNLFSPLPLNVLFWEEEVEIEYINKQFDKVYSHFIIAEIQ